jgi:hypothetical protein
MRPEDHRHLRTIHNQRGLRWRNYGGFALALVGCMQMVGYMTGSVGLRGIGAATAASPLPKVFSDVDGLETFASEFTLRYRDGRRIVVETPITPAFYGRVDGPYNRRNVYGAALSYAPRLPRPLWESVYCHGLAPGGTLRRELGLGPELTDIAVIIRTRSRGRDDVWTLEPACTR